MWQFPSLFLCFPVKEHQNLRSSLKGHYHVSLLPPGESAVASKPSSRIQPPEDQHISLKRQIYVATHLVPFKGCFSLQLCYPVSRATMIVVRIVDSFESILGDSKPSLIASYLCNPVSCFALVKVPSEWGIVNAFVQPNDLLCILVPSWRCFWIWKLVAPLKFWIIEHRVL